ncbi:unnamed protein product, partial [Didymodactylos carnosus]
MKRFRLSPKLRGALKTWTGGGLIFVGMNIYWGSERFYENVLMPFFRLFDAENVHRLSILLTKYNLVPQMKRVDDPILHTKLWNHEFKTPIGLAAGFDKNGEAIEGLSKFGFGFIEIGTVTPKAQYGNEKPRVFRLVEDRAVIN